MAKPRLPRAKAEASGAILKNAGRFARRNAQKQARTIGEPYARMTEEQKACWYEFAEDMPWLNAAHRTLLRLACYHAARLDMDAQFGVSATRVLSSILSKLGATPVDETRVSHQNADDEDPAEQFLSRMH